MIGAAESLRSSVAFLRAHPVIALSLGAAVVLSLCSVCTGFGAIAGPWFVCELYGAQLASMTGARRARGASWLGASMIVSCILIVVAASGWLAGGSFSPDMNAAFASTGPLPWLEALQRIGYVGGSMMLAVGFVAPFLYAPLVLIDRGSRIGGAIIESAWLVARGGVLRHLALTFVVYALQLSPALIFAMVMARTYERAATAIGFVAALPFLPFSIVIGQGILTASYVGVRGRLAPPRTVLARGAPPRGLVVLLTIVIMAPVAALLMLALAALRECPATPGTAPRGEVIADRAIERGREVSVAVRDTTLAVRVRGREVALVAGSDSHAAFPASWDEDVRRIRVLRDGGVYAIEIHAGDDDQVAHVVVDAAGVRSRDWIRDRLRAWVPTWALLAILAAFAACGVLLVRALAPLGALRGATGSSPEERARQRAAAHRRAWAASLALLPFALGALAGGLVSIGWL